MFSFLSSTFVVSKVGTPKPTLLFRPTTWRFFSQSYTIYAEHEDPIAPKLRMDERNIRRREKYHNDQAFREKELARFRSRIRNPLYRDKIKDSAKLRYENWRDHNPEAFQRWIVKSCLLAARLRASDPRYNFSKALHNLLVSDGNAWAREELPWKTHVPVLYPEKVYRKCARCDRRPQKGGLKLWWESCKNNTEGDADEYLCHACYIPKEDWQNALPQGYEDVKSMRELRARKKKLDNSIHDSQDAKSSNSK